jgi:SAM-dependent methyltransferase
VDDQRRNSSRRKSFGSREKRNRLKSEPSKYWDKVYESWEAGSGHTTWRLHSDAVYSRLLLVLLPSPPKGRILKTDAFDEAVSGGIVEELRSPLAQILMIDLSPQMLISVRRRHPWILFAASEVRQVPCAAETFDCIISLSTLDHLESLEEVQVGLREIFRILKGGGRMILTFDNLANPLIRLRRFLPFEWLHKLGLVPYRIGVSCGPGLLRRMVEGTGLQVEDLGAAFHSPRVLMVFCARLIDRIGNPRLQSCFLKSAALFELLSRWPTRFVTGHMIVLTARKPG